ADASFQDEFAQAEFAGFGFEGGEEGASDTVAAFIGGDVHSFELSGLRIDAADCAAADWIWAAPGDEECAVSFGYFVGVEAEMAGALFGVGGGEFGVEGFD